MSINYVKNCPYRFMGLASVCEKVPGNFVCGTKNCWELGERMKGIDWTKIRETDLQRFAKAVNDIDFEEIDRLLTIYSDQQAA
jgi:hypothetical protein